MELCKTSFFPKRETASKQIFKTMRKKEVTQCKNGNVGRYEFMLQHNNENLYLVISWLERKHL